MSEKETNKNKKEEKGSFFSFMKKDKKKKKEKVNRSFIDVFPYLKIDTEDEIIILNDGTFLDILQIETTDLYSKNDDELHQLLHARTGFLRSYNTPYKEVVLNFPVDASVQRNYWLKKMRSTNDPVKLKIIEKNLQALDFIEQERTNREFFMFVFSETKSGLESLVNQIIRMNQFSFPMHELPLQKKKDVLFLMNNPNTKLIRE